MYLEECKGLVCNYFNPLITGISDEGYQLLAKCLLSSYIRQIKCSDKICYEPTVDILLSEVLSWYYNNCLVSLEEQVQRYEQNEALNEVIVKLLRKDKLEVLKDIPAIMALNSTFLTS